MNNQNLKHFNGINATDLDATLAVDVSTGMQTVEPKHYLVTLQQVSLLNTILIYPLLLRLYFI